MAESEQSEGESQARQTIPELAQDSGEATLKRLREESSEDEKVQVPAKKLCKPPDNSVPENQETQSAEVNGTMEQAEHHADEKLTEKKSDTDNALLLEKESNTKQGVLNEESKETKDEEDSKQENGIYKSDKASEDSKDTENKDSVSKESVIKVETESTADEEEKEKESEQNKEPIKKDIIKLKNDNSEVVGGLELSVECASDKESSPSESENEKEKKPKLKTIIVKAQPNDSELEVSSSEADKSDSQEVAEVTTPRKTTKKGKRKGSRTSFSKRSTGSEDSHDDISDDEDYSPVSKKKARKTPSKRGVKTSPDSRRGRGRGRKPVAKPVEKEVEVEDEEEDNEDTTSNKKDDQFSDAESMESKSKSDNESGSEKDGKRRRKSAAKPGDDKRIKTLKKYIRTAGIHVKSYNDLWATCKSNAAKVRCLKELLEKNGVTGRPTLEKCKKLKLKNERLKDISELNTSNIISEGRVTRARRNMDPKKESKTPETPTKQREARTTFKRIMSVVDSDSE